MAFRFTHLIQSEFFVMIDNKNWKQLSHEALPEHMTKILSAEVCPWGYVKLGCCLHVVCVEHLEFVNCLELRHLHRHHRKIIS